MVYLLSLLISLLMPLFSACAAWPVAAAPAVTDLEAGEVAVPVIMYHSVLKHGDSVYIVTPEQLENDLKEVMKRGYHTVTSTELVKYVLGKAQLPLKPIVITFDDGHYNNMYYAMPLLKKYGMKAVVNIIGKFSEYSSNSGDDSHPEYSHLTFKQIAAMHRSGIFEIGNHTYNLHGYKPRYGIEQKPGESDEHYARALSEDVLKLQRLLAENSGVTPVSFAYPFGRYNNLSRKTLLQLGFKVLYNCSEGINIVKMGDADALTKMHRYNRNSRLSTYAFFDKIERHTAKLERRT